MLELRGANARSSTQSPDSRVLVSRCLSPSLHPSWRAWPGGPVWGAALAWEDWKCFSQLQEALSFVPSAGSSLVQASVISPHFTSYLLTPRSPHTEFLLDPRERFGEGRKRGICGVNGAASPTPLKPPEAPLPSVSELGWSSVWGLCCLLQHSVSWGDWTLASVFSPVRTALPVALRPAAPPRAGVRTGWQGPHRCLRHPLCRLCSLLQ